MKKTHHYKPTIIWKADDGPGTLDYKAYSRNHEISFDDKPPLPASSDISFRGDASRYSPEDLLVASLASCHMLWYLHLCAVNGIVVVEYIDKAVGVMQENENGSGQFDSVTLLPRVTITDSSMRERAQALHAEANRMCFIARSVNFPVQHEPQVYCSEQV